jgi:hypothetical protein
MVRPAANRQRREICGELTTGIVRQTSRCRPVPISLRSDGHDMRERSDAKHLCIRFRLLHSNFYDQSACATFPRANRDRLPGSAARARHHNLTQVGQSGGDWDDSLIDAREDQDRERSAARDDGRRPGEASEHFLLPRSCDSSPIHESTGGDAGPDRSPQEPPLGWLQGTPGHGVRVGHDRSHAHDADEECGRLMNIPDDGVRGNRKCGSGRRHAQPAPVPPVRA